MATIQGVAKRAGVSIATVSRVLNGAAYVNRERLEGYRKALQMAGLSYDPTLERIGTFKGADGRDGTAASQLT